MSLIIYLESLLLDKNIKITLATCDNYLTVVVY